jgi:hypothetical protein
MQDLQGQHGIGKVYFETIRVRIYENEEDMAAERVYVESTTPCEEGSFTVEDLKRGTYLVNVAAMADDSKVETYVDGGVDTSTDGSETKSELRAFFESTREVVVPSKDDGLVKFPMDLGTGSIEVSWDFEQGSCNAVWSEQEDDWVEVAEVSISINGQSVGSDANKVLECTAGKWKVDNLVWDKYSVKVEAEDSTGKYKFEGSFEEDVEIRPGTHIRGPSGRIVLKEI